MKRAFRLQIVFRAVLLSLGIGLASSAGAQATFKVGDKVEIYCNCLGPMAWTPGTVEQVVGGSLIVRYGGGKYQTKQVPSSPDTIRSPGAALDQEQQNKQVAAFMAEAAPYRTSMQQFLPYVAKGLDAVGLPVKPAAWQKTLADLAALDQLCTTRYAGLKDSTDVPYNRDLNWLPATWCAVAKRRVEIEPKAKADVAKQQVRLTVTEDDLKLAFSHEKNLVTDEIQQLLYARDQWRRQQAPAYEKAFAELGVAMPADFYAAVEKRADELAKLIQETAPKRSWTKPPFSDAAVESFVRSKYAADPRYKQGTLYKTGVDYASWVKRENLSLVGSDSQYRYYKVEYTSYKRGWALIKLPGQPFCQAQEWIVGKGKGGGTVLVSLGGGGIYMQCP